MRHLHFCIFFCAISGAIAQTPCESGFAGDYPCNQLDLYAIVTPEELMAAQYRGFYVNDIWGWTDPETGKEYALTGLTDGVAFVDVTDPLAPVVIGKLEESVSTTARASSITEVQHEEKSTWRDMKVYGDFMFVVSDRNGTHGMQVFDLKRLRSHDGGIPQVFHEDALYDQVHSAHNVAINEATGFAYITGTYQSPVCSVGGLHIVDIHDPLNPTYAGCFDDDGYTHDAQCVIYSGPDTDYQGKEICFNSNEDSFTIVDVDNKENMQMISRTSYNKVKYSHQGWLTEDHRFFLMNDELDEFEYGFTPRTLIWKIEDLDNPVLIGEYYNEEPAVDHNLYTHEGLVYESNYLSGVRVLETEKISDGMLREVAFFDTYPAANAITYGGSWSNYPYFKSGTLVASDMTGGLFILKLNRATDPISSHPVPVETCEADTVSFSVEVAEGTFSWQWQKYDSLYHDIEDSEHTAGATTSTLTMLADEDLMETSIRCRVTDATGNVFYSYPAQYAINGYLPDPDFSFTIHKQQVTFTNTSSGAHAYRWDFGDGNGSEDENPIHTYEVLGRYDVLLRASNDCGSDSIQISVLIPAVTGIETMLSGIQVFPNPSTGTSFIESPVPATVTLVGVAGQVIFTRVLQPGRNPLDFSNLQKGMYVLKLASGSTFETRKLILH